MQFTKMHGAGNDYVYVDCFAQPIPKNISELARRISDRHFGVGGDGLILICPTEQADVEMRMFNADGSASEMCGNGIRCVAKYVYDHNICHQETLKIKSGEQLLTLNLYLSQGQVDRVRVDMGEPVLKPADIPTTLRGLSDKDPACNVPLVLSDRQFDVTCVSMGNPHCVTFVEELTDDWVLRIGPQIEADPHFPNRINAEFVEILSPSKVRQRTWERGSGETMACGTGASATCVAGVLTKKTGRRILVHLPGGDLEIEWSEADNHVYMTGPAAEVFSGNWPE